MVLSSCLLNLLLLLYAYILIISSPGQVALGGRSEGHVIDTPECIFVFIVIRNHLKDGDHLFRSANDIEGTGHRCRRRASKRLRDCVNLDIGTQGLTCEMGQYRACTYGRS